MGSLISACLGQSDPRQASAKRQRQLNRDIKQQRKQQEQEKKAYSKQLKERHPEATHEYELYDHPEEEVAVIEVQMTVHHPKHAQAHAQKHLHDDTSGSQGIKGKFREKREHAKEKAHDLKESAKEKKDEIKTKASEIKESAKEKAGIA